MVTFSWVRPEIAIATLSEHVVFQVEEKFQNPEQIWPKTVILVNANDWNSKFAYDLDPGIDTLVPLSGNGQ
jgi:hypothetical protein